MMDPTLFQSNLYINQTQKRVSALLKAELFASMEINMVTGYHELPSWNHYWNGEQDLSVPFISNALSWNRFLLMLLNIHVNYNSAVPDSNNDKLFKGAEHKSGIEKFCLALVSKLSPEVLIDFMVFH